MFVNLNPTRNSPFPRSALGTQRHTDTPPRPPNTLFLSPPERSQGLPRHRSLLAVFAAALGKFGFPDPSGYFKGPWGRGAPAIPAEAGVVHRPNFNLLVALQE